MSATRITRHVNAPRAIVYRALLDRRAANGYLTKPFSPEQHHAVIESIRPLIDEQIALVI